MFWIAMGKGSTEVIVQQRTAKIRIMQLICRSALHIAILKLRKAHPERSPDTGFDLPENNKSFKTNGLR